MAGDNERFDALSPRWLNIRKKIIAVDISDDKAELTIIDGWCNAIKNMWKELEKNGAESDFRQGVISGNNDLIRAAILKCPYGNQLAQMMLHAPSKTGTPQEVMRRVLEQGLHRLCEAMKDESRHDVAEYHRIARRIDSAKASMGEIVDEAVDKMLTPGAKWKPRRHSQKIALTDSLLGVGR